MNLKRSLSFQSFLRRARKSNYPLPLTMKPSKLMQSWKLQQPESLVHPQRLSNCLISLSSSQLRDMQLMPPLQSLHNKLLANLFLPVLEDPVKEMEKPLAALLQQSYHNQKGPDLCQPSKLPQLQLLPPAHYRRSNRRC